MKLFQTEGTYETVVSACNPLDGCVSSKMAIVEVLETVGPIILEDGVTVTDMVSSVPTFTFI